MRFRLLAVTLLACCFAGAGLGIAADATAGAANRSALRLTYQTPSLSASLSGQIPLTLGLEATGAASDAVISAQLSNRLTTRSGLTAALGAQGPSNPLGAATPGVQISCLPASSHGGRSLVLNVMTTTEIAPTLPGGCGGASRAPVLNLACTVGSGRCNGVYPLSLVLSSHGSVLTRLVTLIVFSERPAPTPLRVGTVLTLPSSATPAQVSAVARALKAAPATSVDLVIEPALLTRLATTKDGAEAIGQLRSALGTSSRHVVLPSPYVPVDPGALSVSGLSGELDAQLHRGDQVLRGAGLSTGGRIWVATSPTTQSTTGALSALGVSQMIIDDASLAEPTVSSLTWGQPFSLSPGSSSVLAMAADPQLGAEARTADGVLGAARVLGDLAFLHFERPGLTIPQGVVMRLDASGVSASGLSALLSGLAEQPVDSPVTLAELFAQVPQGANGAPATRRLSQSGPSTAWPAAQVATVRAEQQRQAAFASATGAKAPIIRTLNDQLLSAERDGLSTSGRSRALSATTGALDAQLHSVAISGAIITITALRTSVPITLTSSAGYPITGILHLSSTHLTFPKGATSTELLDKPTKSLRIEVEAVTTGDLPMAATLSTPKGDLVIAHQRIVVRATHTSIVAIILTVGAAAVLFGWWLRDWWRRPKRRARR